MISIDDQLKNKANFIGDKGQLFLVRCMACPDGDPLWGRENYSMAVASGQCAWCGWKAPRVQGEFDWEDDNGQPR